MPLYNSTQHISKRIPEKIPEKLCFLPHYISYFADCDFIYHTYDQMIKYDAMPLIKQVNNTQVLTVQLTQSPKTANS